MYLKQCCRVYIIYLYDETKTEYILFSIHLLTLLLWKLCIFVKAKCFGIAIKHLPLLAKLNKYEIQFKFT